jgi:hypothetical protein
MAQEERNQTRYDLKSDKNKVECLATAPSGFLTCLLVPQRSSVDDKAVLRRLRALGEDVLAL